MPDSGYQVCIRGTLGAVLVAELGDLQPVTSGETTRLTIATDDQATLHGTLRRLRDLGLVIDSVTTYPAGVGRPSTRSRSTHD